MATIRLTVQLGSAALPDTVANERRMFVYTGVVPIGGSPAIEGNIGARVPNGQYAYDLNRPRVPGTITVTAHQPQRFNSDDLTGRSELVNQLATHVESGFIEALDLSAPIAGQTGAAAVMAAPSGGFITITGLTGIVDPDSLGHFITITGSGAGNDGTFEIVRVNSATSVDIVATVPGSEGSLTWTELGDAMDRAALEAYI